MGGGASKIALGDPALLAPLLFKENFGKKYSLGIVPHWSMYSDQVFRDLSKKYPNSIIINVLDDPLIVLRQIAQCECVVSTSLHGLIVADAFGVPNQWIYTRSLGHSDFKFLDYYSAFDISKEAIDLNTNIFDINYIKSNYKITKSMIYKKQNDLLDAFLGDNYLSIEPTNALNANLPNGNFLVNFYDKFLCVKNGKLSTGFADVINIELRANSNLCLKYNGYYISSIFADGSVKLSQNPAQISYKKDKGGAIFLKLGEWYLSFDKEGKFSLSQRAGENEAFVCYENYI